MNNLNDDTNELLTQTDQDYYDAEDAAISKAAAASRTKRLNLRGLIAIALLVIIGAVAAPRIYADTFQDQINQLRTENQQNQTAVDSLLLQARDYQDAIAKLQAQIDIVQQNISVNQARQVTLSSKSLKSRPSSTPSAKSWAPTSRPCTSTVR